MLGYLSVPRASLNLASSSSKNQFVKKRTKWLDSHHRFVLFVLCLHLMPLTLAAKKTTDDNKKSCDHCRELVGKFIDEFKLTDRGLFEGGDTDWEIKNLKDYKKSEVRFIEITEKIYKCKVDHVTRLLEEVEENLEDFWRDHWQHVGDSNELDSYLCVSLKKVCCPYGFFGAECSPCQSGEEATAGCSGHGSCNGNGTRGGTGKCKCDEEYRGSFCEECKKGYQREEENQTCVDIDECAQKDKPNLCEDGKYCDNNPGYYSCRKCHEACNNLTCNGPEPENCTGDSCAEGYLKLLDGDSVIGCKKDEEEEEEENLALSKLNQFVENIPMEVYTVGGYISLVSLGAVALSRYNPMVALTMVMVSMLFGIRHYNLMFTTVRNVEQKTD